MFESLLKQTSRDFAVFISDNASDDATQEICKEYVSRDSRFVYYRQEYNKGSSYNGPFVISSSDSQYFMLLGAHDYISDDYIETQIKFLDSNPEYILSYSLTQWIDEKDNLMEVSGGGDFVFDDKSPVERYIRSAVAPKNECTAICGVFRRSAFEGMKYYSFAGPDLFIVTKAQYMGKVNRINRPIYFRRRFHCDRDEYMYRVTGKKDLKNLNENNYYPLFYAQIDDYLSLDIPIFTKYKNVFRLVFGMIKVYGLFYYSFYRKSLLLMPLPVKKYIKSLIKKGRL